MDRVAKHLFLFEGSGVVRDFQGTFSEYLDYRREAYKQGVRPIPTPIECDCEEPAHLRQGGRASLLSLNDCQAPNCTPTCLARETTPVQSSYRSQGPALWLASQPEPSACHGIRRQRLIQSQHASWSARDTTASEDDGSASTTTWYLCRRG